MDTDHLPRTARENTCVDVGVALVRWPADERERCRLAAHGLPRLLVLSSAQPPPITGDPLEDWVRQPLDTGEVRRRADILARRHQERGPTATVDGDGIVRVGHLSAVVTELQQAVLAVLLGDLGAPVGFRTLQAACAEAGGTSDANAVRAVLGRLRRRVGPLGLVLHTLRNGAVMLELVARRQGDDREATLEALRLEGVVHGHDANAK
jgi:hypothetical protein